VSAPERWLTSGLAEAPDGARELLEAAQPLKALSPEVHARLLERAQEIAALKPALGLSALLASKPAAFGVTAIVAATAVIGALERGRSTDARVDPPAQVNVERAPAPAPIVAPPAPERIVAVEELELAPVLPQRARTAAAPLAAELEIVERARRALAADPEGALRICNEHARRFPTGQLGSTREAIAIQALEKLGRTEQARSRAETLLNRDPHSLHSEAARRVVEQAR